MIKSKEWNWELNKEDFWKKPFIESYYYGNIWKEKGFNNILDLGCGLGRHAILFGKMGFEVNACDLSEYAINHLNEWSKKENLNINTKVCNMLDLKYNDNSFDCIFSYHVISHTDTIGARKVFSEIKRVLKPNGEVFLTLCSKDTWSFKEAGFPHIDPNTIVKTDDGPEKGIPHFYVDLDDLKELLNGFEIINIRHIDDIFYTDKFNHSKHYFIYAKNIK